MGVDGLAFWDTNGRSPHLEEWSMLRRLRHQAGLGGWSPDQWPAYRLVPLHSLSGHIMDKYSPYWSAWEAIRTVHKECDVGSKCLSNVRCSHGRWKGTCLFEANQVFHRENQINIPQGEN